MPRTKQFDRDEVINKAVNLFWERGYHATSMQDLVDHLGINRASLYDTFGGKRVLFDQAFEAYQRENQDALRAYFDQCDTVVEGIRQMFVMAIDRLLSDTKCKGCFLGNAATELLPGDDDLREKLHANNETVTSLFKAFLKKGIENGELSPDLNIEHYAQFLFTLYNGLNVVSMVNPDRQVLMDGVEAGLTSITSK